MCTHTHTAIFLSLLLHFNQKKSVVQFMCICMLFCDVLLEYLIRAEVDLQMEVNIL